MRSVKTYAHKSAEEANKDMDNLTKAREMYSLDAEASVIGAIIINSDLAEKIGSFLDRTHFYNEDYAELYALSLKATAQGIKPDCVSLSSIAETLPSGEKTIVIAGDIQQNKPSAANGLYFAKLVLERFKARQLRKLGQSIVALASQDGDIADQIAQAQEMVMNLDAESDRQDVYQMGDVITELVEDMEALLEGSAPVSVGTGLEDVDKLAKGFRKGTLNIIAGRPGSGKSLMANMVARQAAVDNNGSALVFSLEMSNKELAKRMTAALATVTLDDIESSEAIRDPIKCDKVARALNTMKNSDIRVCDRPSLEFAKMCSIARYQHRASPISVMVVDYIGLVGYGENRRIQNRNQELGAISRGLKQLAKELDIPIVALAQLNRGIEGRADAMPKMSDLRDSGEIEQDADVIMICHRRDDQAGRDGLTFAEVVKCRHGQVGGAVIQMQGHYAKFVPAAGTDYDQALNGGLKSSGAAYFAEQFN